jgi:FAD synthetase
LLDGSASRSLPVLLIIFYDTMIKHMAKKANKPCVLVFGTFDGIHEGHMHFLKEASKLGDLTVSVSSDENVITLKKHEPVFKASLRKRKVLELKITDSVIIGEKGVETWNHLKKIKPDIIALGYDQRELKKSLMPLAKIYNFKIKVLKSFKPKIFHSRLLSIKK